MDYQKKAVEIKITLCGDNIELLKQYPDNYFDSVVTDCPYGLGKEPNALKLLQDWNRSRLP